MFKIYKSTIHIGESKNTQGRLEYRVEESSGSSLSKMLTIPAMIVGAIVGTLVLSVFFVVLLIPLGIMGFKTWRLLKSVRKHSTRQSDGDSIIAEYTILPDTDKK